MIGSDIDGQPIDVPDDVRAFFGIVDGLHLMIHPSCYGYMMSLTRKGIRADAYLDQPPQSLDHVRAMAQGLLECIARQYVGEL